MTTNFSEKNTSLILLDQVMLDIYKPCSSALSFAKNDFVFQASAPKKFFYILISGRVKLFRVSSLGREVTQWFCFPGEVFGLSDIAFPQTNKQSVFAQCCERSEILAIPLNQFNNFVKHSPDVAIQIIEQLTVRLKIVGDTLLNFTSDNVRTRLVKILTRLTMRFGVPYKKGVLINVNLTHKEISDMIGTCRQSVTTALGELKAEGHVQVINSHFYIDSIENFEKLVDVPEDLAVRNKQASELVKEIAVH